LSNSLRYSLPFHAVACPPNILPTTNYIARFNFILPSLGPKGG